MQSVMKQGITIMRMTGLLAAWALAVLGSLTVQPAHGRDLGYDPGADPFERYHEAIATAATENKLVLVIAGGDWCSWCHTLDRFLARNEDVQRSLEGTFVVLKVYVGDENYNEDFFEQLPPARGAPHFWIISPERHVLASQSTGMLERGRRGYDRHQFLGFIAQWNKRVQERVAARTERSHASEERS